jgi:hypothetical protein
MCNRSHKWLELDFVDCKTREQRGAYALQDSVLMVYETGPNTTVVDREFQREPGASAPGKSQLAGPVQARILPSFYEKQ